MLKSKQATVPPTPQRVRGLDADVFWEHVAGRSLRLQRCGSCGTFRYPPAPVCPSCLADTSEWTPVAGAGTILSWVIYHRGYLPAYPPPYNVVSVRLDEGPILVSNLEGPEPEGNWIGQRVRLIFTDMPDGFVLPRFTLAANSTAL